MAGESESGLDFKSAKEACEPRLVDTNAQWQPVLDPTSGQPCTDEWYGYMFKCSACGHITISDDALECSDRYCYNCGRPMNGGTNK